MDPSDEPLSVSDYDDDSESTYSAYSFASSDVENGYGTDSRPTTSRREEPSDVKTALEALSNYDYQLQFLTAETCEQDLRTGVRTEKSDHALTGVRTAVSVSSMNAELITADDGAEIDVETGASVYSMDTEVLTAWSCVETAVSGSRVEKDLLTAYSHTDAKTALSEISIYSEYSQPPSETNVEIEYDIIADASPVSTAVDGSASWYALPNSETEKEPNPPFMVGSASVTDSIECLLKLPDAKLRPVEDFEKSGIKLINTGLSKTGSDIEEEQYEYSYYSDGPSETNVTMDGFDDYDDRKRVDHQADGDIPDHGMEETAEVKS